ncbi:pyridoxal phosphate-dependent decarboxylase family protein [Anaeromyxobacter oryzae]|uniref:Pyridoxal-dependent decarboxylase n=1 Tax=Anaeromyxobacter oryzae TaxID=2918170 RepID=A0ABN6MWW5_9BACT|nr:aminotransferase class V-fold PLP-dependent enzyme [Anaeromyxobacter oryzae]BDG05449.1 pyridoxal-dependent decarboxylase [Anaeromyxobacter oryzae]
MPTDLPTDEWLRLADAVARLARDWLDDLDRRPIAPRTRGAEAIAALGGEAPEVGLGHAVVDRLREVLPRARAQNGRFLGYVLGSGEPAGAVADLLASVLNQNVTAWRSSPAAVTVERTVVSWLAAALGCGGFGGSLTGGGSAANLMGLAMAREGRAPAREAGRPEGVVYASEEVHMSIPKAVALLGIGTRNLRRIAVDGAQRMRVDALERALAEDVAAGRRPIAVVATAGTVATGAIDPLDAIADVAARYGAWLHVDGAYGALAALAAPDRLAGLRRADSLSVDAHKWLYQAVDCGCLLFRDAAAARRAFSDSGEYVKTGSDDAVEGFAFFDESVELSRRFRALRLWTSIQFHGLGAFRAAIARDLAHARALAARVAAEPRLELLAAGDLSAVCFRHRWPADADARNAALLRAVNARGRVYLSNAVVGGVFALRACFVNHRTTDADVEEVVQEVLAAGEGVG